jgi:trimethylguanosine synthase
MCFITIILGADLSEKNMVEKHMESINDEYQRRNSKTQIASDDVMTEEESKIENMYHHERNNSLPELFGDEGLQNSWEKYWAKNGERLIWQSWIEKYIDYINPDYLDENKMPVFMNESSADSNRLADEHAFSFDDKDIANVNSNVPTVAAAAEIVISSPAKHNVEDLITQGWNPLSPLESTKFRQQQQHNSRHQNSIENLLSPRCESINSSIPLTLGTTDSMTNVTRMTISSYGFESSHVTSESTPTTPSDESNTVSSFSDSEESDNQMTTRIANECEKLLMENKSEEHYPPNDKDSEEYWQKRWQSHAQEQYVKYYNEFMDSHHMLQDEMSNSFKSDSGFLPGEVNKFNKRRKKSGRKKGGHSLQRLVANLNLKSDLVKCLQDKPEDPVAGGNQHHDTSHSDSTVVDNSETSLMQSMGLPVSFGRNNVNNSGDGEEPPEDRPVSLKRSHESDTEEPNVDKIKSHFELMGYNFVDKNGSDTNGDIVYRKKHVRLHNRMLKMFTSTSTKPKHSYFDDDGNEINEESNADLHTSSDEDIPIPARLNTSILPLAQALSENILENKEIKINNNHDDNDDGDDAAAAAAAVNINLSIDQEYDSNYVEEATANVDDENGQVQSKKEKKKKRKGKFQANIPAEIAKDRVLKKYWYNRFSLFSLYDFGIKLDRGELFLSLMNFD